MRKYVIVDSQGHVCGRCDTIQEAWERVSKLSNLKRYRVLVEISSIAFDTETYYRLDGTRYEAM